jgi:hypothetical protein
MSITKKNSVREWDKSFRIFPTRGKPGCYTILFSCSYKTQFGRYDVLGEGIPEEVAALILLGVQEAKGKLASDPGILNRSMNAGARTAFTAFGADVYGRRDTDWWWGLVSDEEIEKGNEGGFESLNKEPKDKRASRVGPRIFKNTRTIKN